MKMATVEVVPPSMCSDVEIGAGISSRRRESTTPDAIDKINGFLESLFRTRFNPFHIVDSSRL